MSFHSQERRNPEEITQMIQIICTIAKETSMSNLYLDCLPDPDLFLMLLASCTLVVVEPEPLGCFPFLTLSS